MFASSTLLTVYLAPKDAYTYHNFREWHARTKRRWRSADVMGADEVAVLENNRRHNIKYNKELKIFGWINDSTIFNNRKRKYTKWEASHFDIVGDVYYNYVKKFGSFVLDWWGIGAISREPSKRNLKSIPNSPMLDVSIGFDKNSMMEKMYLKGMSYDEASATTFKGKHRSAEMIAELTEFNKNDGMGDEEAYNEALRMIEIVNRNLAFTKNSPTANEYNFMLNYYNKFVNKKIREMMKIQLNLWFLKEVMLHHPNMGIYVLGPYNVLNRVQGIVSKREQNVVLQMEKLSKTPKFTYEFTYSVARQTLVNDADKGFIPAYQLTRERSKILNLMAGRRKLNVYHRYRTETFYDLVLDGNDVNGYTPWFDALHNCWLSPNYSKIKNLDGLDVVC